MRTALIEKYRTLFEIRRKLKINRMTCCLSDDGVRNCAKYLMYRVQSTLYAFFREFDDALTWEEFVSIVCSSKEIREAAQTVAVTAMVNFNMQRFDFMQPETEVLGEELGDAEIQIAQLFQEDAGEGLVILFMLRAQIAHHRLLQRERGEQYTLKRYMNDLKKDPELRKHFGWGFRRGVAQMDFSSAWTGGGIQRILELYDLKEKERDVCELTVERAFEEI